MASLSFDANSVEITSRDPIPAGIYEALICDSEVRPTRSGNGKGINLTFEILSGPHKGRKVFAWINFQHPKAEAQRIGQEELARICKAVGIGKLDDTAQLHNLPMMITVAIDKDDQSRNVIKNYKPKEGAAPAQTASAPAASAGAAASGDAPWKR